MLFYSSTVSGEWSIRSTEFVKLLLLWSHHGWWPHACSTPYYYTPTQHTEIWTWPNKLGVRGFIYICARGVTIRISCIERFTGSSKWKWSSLSPWSGDFGVNRARACRYLVVWNALGEGSDLISSLSSAGMFPWQRSTVSVSRCRCLNVKCLFIFVIITVANKHTFYILKRF